VPELWIDSGFEYMGIMQGLMDRKDPEILFFRATFWKNGTAELGEWRRFENGMPTFDESCTGNYSIVQTDGAGHALSSVGFNVTFSNFSNENRNITFDAAPAAFNVPYANGTKIIEIRNATGNVVASRTVSTNPPSVHVTSPSDELVLTPTMTQITWEASDPDGDKLTYDLLVSGDGGSSWEPVATGLKQTSHNLNFACYPGGIRYLVKVIVGDGVNSAEDVSDKFFTVSSFTGSLASVPQMTTAGNSVFYILNITSYGGFSEQIRLNASSSTTNLNFAWASSPTLTLPADSSTRSS
jgi:hypothetical protein